MTKAELVERVANQINLTKKQTEVVVNTVFSSITESLAEGKKVELRGFGSFRIRQRNARTGRNPKSGQKVEVPSKKVPFFSGRALKLLLFPKKKTLFKNVYQHCTNIELPRHHVCVNRLVLQMGLTWEWVGTSR